AVEFEIALSGYERRARGIHAADIRADPRQMQRESTLVAEDVERVAACMARSGDIVLALIEEGSGLLPGGRAVVEAQCLMIAFAIHCHTRLGLFAIHQTAGDCRQLFQLANSWLNSFDNPRRLEFGLQRR